MKATRRDIITALRRHELDKIDAETAVLNAQLKPIPTFVDPLTDRALAAYKRKPKVKKLLKVLDFAKIPYKLDTTFCSGKQGSRNEARVHIEIIITDAAREVVNVTMTDREYKQVNRAIAANTSTHDKINKLCFRRANINCEGGNVLIDEVISKILVEGDATITAFIAKVSERLTEQLAIEEPQQS